MNPFRELLRGKLVLVGVGNTLRGDDGLGPALARRLARKLPCIDAGSAAENHLGRILRENPDTVLVVDAVHLGRSPGEFEILEPGEIPHSGTCTHDLSLRLLLEELGRRMRGKVLLLGVQPQRLEFGQKISAAVRASLRRLEAQLLEAAG